MCEVTGSTRESSHNKTLLLPWRSLHSIQVLPSVLGKSYHLPAARFQVIYSFIQSLILNWSKADKKITDPWPISSVDLWSENCTVQMLIIFCGMVTKAIEKGKRISSGFWYSIQYNVWWNLTLQMSSNWLGSELHHIDWKLADRIQIKYNNKQQHIELYELIIRVLEGSV